MASRVFSYPVGGKNHHVGKLIIQPQLDGIYIKTEPDTYIDKHELEFLRFWLDDYQLRIGNGGEVRLILPRKQKYGSILRQIAKAYYLIQCKGIYPTMPPSNQITKEA